MITDKVGGSSAKPEVSKQSKEKRLKYKVSGYKSQSKRRSIAGCRLLLRTLLILHSFSPASPCFLYLTKCHAIPNHKTNSCNFFNLLPKMMSSTPAACLWSFSYSRLSHAIPYQELQLLSIILWSMPLPSSLASPLGTKLIYCPFYPLHKTKLIEKIIIHKFSKNFNGTIQVKNSFRVNKQKI